MERLVKLRLGLEPLDEVHYEILRNNAMMAIAQVFFSFPSIELFQVFSNLRTLNLKTQKLTSKEQRDPS